MYSGMTCGAICSDDSVAWAARPNKHYVTLMVFHSDEWPCRTITTPNTVFSRSYLRQVCSKCSIQGTAAWICGYVIVLVCPLHPLWGYRNIVATSAHGTRTRRF
jgi:hypothetical protein